MFIPIESLTAVQADLGDCQRCKLHLTRTNLVFGDGPSNAKIVLVGEAPGADEDTQGLPFVGRAGQLLTKMIDSTAEKGGWPIRRGDVYICNVLKCRPPANRPPEEDEVSACHPFLARQIESVNPKAILVMGNSSSRLLLGDPRLSISKIRGAWHSWRSPNGQDYPVMPTFHPSYLLRGFTDEQKLLAWQDLKVLFSYVYDTVA
jgi:uracil-DNA glycosylase